MGFALDVMRCKMQSCGGTEATVKSRLHSSRGRLKERMIAMVSDYLRDQALPEEFTRRILSNIPPGRRDSNSYAQGLCMMLGYSGVPADYDTLMGDSGLAFIAQGEEGRPLIDGAIDIGWWPMTDLLMMFSSQRKSPSARSQSAS